VHDGVGAPRPPRLGQLRRLKPIRGLAEPGERVADAHVTGGECVGIAEGAHRHVRRRPGAHAEDVEQRCQSGGGVGAGIEAHPLGCHQESERAQRLAALARERQLGGIDLGELLRGREAVRDRAVGLGQAFAVAVDEPAEHGARRRHGDLLADDRPYGQLETVHAAGHTHPGPAQGEVAQDRVRPQLRVDRDGVGIEVEQAATACDRRGQVA